MLRSTIGLILLCLTYGVQCELSKDFKSMIFYLTNRHGNDYDSYGCWCGTGANTSTHEKTVDESDLCCKLHTICYSNIPERNNTCNEETRYRSIFYNDQIQCIDNDDTPLQELCSCDRQAAYCLREALSTFDLIKKTIEASDACESEAPILNWDPIGITVVGGSSGLAGNSERLLNLPYSLLLHSNTTLYVSDQNNHRVQKWFIGASNGTTAAGQANGEVGLTAKHFSRPGGLVLDMNENLYVVDINNHRVQFWKNSAAEGITIGGMTGISGAELNQLNNPFGIARNSRTGELYIADRDNHRVMSYAMNNSSGTVVAGGHGPGIGKRQLHSPIGVYFDVSTNSLLIVNYGMHNIVRWKIGEDNWTLIVGSATGISGSTSTLLNQPIGVTMDRWRNIYVADTSNHRIQFFLPEQINGTTIAGIAGSPGSSSKQLRYPFALVLDSQLNLYVSDTYNHRIQKFVLLPDFN